mmetsp:Transcript_34028/g.39273  ORF Transcript_34028/g.39273 Transcript_34028/m.39273 type:complete len:115 (+) Transcript_34028:207-551(+)
MDIFFDFRTIENVYKLLKKAEYIEGVLKRAKKIKTTKRYLTEIYQKSDSDSSLEFVENDESKEASDSEEKEIKKEYDFILKNPCGQFKSVYPEGMRNLKELLFSEDQETQFLKN